jgi:hypothetical protein
VATVHASAHVMWAGSGLEWGFTESLFWAGMKAGPMYVGTNWYRGMMETDGRGSTRSHRRPRRRSSVLYRRVRSGRRRSLQIDQTWGFGWGKKGFARIRRAVLFDLIFNQQGDAIQLVK